MDFQVLFYAFFGGLLPAALWLWFWLKEDSVHPEPRGLIVITFGAGMVAVVFTLFLQQFIYKHTSSYIGETSITFYFLLALVEEVLKYIAAYVVALRSRAFDEPIDALIYLVTAALGFTALENAFFLFGPLSSGNILDTVVTGNMRFVGASVLHVMTSAIVGLSLALSFYKSRTVRRYMILIGILVATLLHTLFNLSIMSNSGSNLFVTFLVLWFSVIGLLLFFEKIKRLNQINTI
jgi:RsiW-degrading membrane proteinase PrsW (M82 family)